MPKILFNKYNNKVNKKINISIIRNPSKNNLKFDNCNSSLQENIIVNAESTFLVAIINMILNVKHNNTIWKIIKKTFAIINFSVYFSG